MKKTIFIFYIFIQGTILSAQSETPVAESEMPDSLKQLPPIDTDRPDQTESSSTVPAKTLQIETGFAYETTEDNDYKMENWFMGTTLLRYGVWDHFEIRMGSYYQTTNIKEIESGRDSTQQGMGPLLLGFKVYIIEEKGLRPEISILADITLRHVGATDYRPVYSYPMAKIAASHTLSRKLSLGYNAGFAYNGDNADGFFVYSIVLGYSITPKFSAYGEFYGTFDHGDHPNQRMDGGFTYLVRNNLQLDISAGTGFDNTVDKNFISMGLSWRIPR